MKMAVQKYDAFISYRHIQPDRAVAERIHRKLESFRLPKEVAKKVGRNKLNRVFRDEAEFAVSDDLSEAITEALENSEYLIVIASPSYLESPWCIKEVETFLQIKDRKHILVAIADGEPETAFPKILTYEEIVKTDENGNEVKETITHEPLAADCRAEKASERNKKVDLAVIRLIASIFSLSFDDLKQRQREAEIARRRRTAIITIIILLAIVAQALYFLGKISKQNKEIKDKNEAALAASAETLFSEGKRMDAIYTARSILSDKYNKNINNERASSQKTAYGLAVFPRPASQSVVQFEASTFQNGYTYAHTYLASYCGSELFWENHPSSRKAEDGFGENRFRHLPMYRFQAQPYYFEHPRHVRYPWRVLPWCGQRSGGGRERHPHRWQQVQSWSQVADNLS